MSHAHTAATALHHGFRQPPVAVPGTAGLSAFQTAAVYRLRLACARFTELEAAPPERPLTLLHETAVAMHAFAMAVAACEDAGLTRRNSCVAPRGGPRPARGRRRSCTGSRRGRAATRATSRPSNGCAMPATAPSPARCRGPSSSARCSRRSRSSTATRWACRRGRSSRRWRPIRRAHRLDRLRRLPRPVADPGLRPAVARHVRAGRRGRRRPGLRARAARSARRPLPRSSRAACRASSARCGTQARSISWSPAGCSTTCRIAGRWRR